MMASLTLLKIASRFDRYLSFSSLASLYDKASRVAFNNASCLTGLGM
jgi:hypothetical protein